MKVGVFLSSTCVPKEKDPILWFWLIDDGIILEFNVRPEDIACEPYPSLSFWTCPIVEGCPL